MKKAVFLPVAENEENDALPYVNWQNDINSGSNNLETVNNSVQAVPVIQQTQVITSDSD